VTKIRYVDAAHSNLSGFCAGNVVGMLLAPAAARVLRPWILERRMPHLDVFEPSTDRSTAAAFAADVEWLTSHGVSVSRYTVANDPEAFAAHPLVRDALRRDGDACLPLVIMNGDIVSAGAYPRRAALAGLTGLIVAARPNEDLRAADHGRTATSR
jgi:hypothetical protein